LASLIISNPQAQNPRPGDVGEVDFTYTITAELDSTATVSRQTLYRRLEDEGTSFEALLDDIRRRSAARYLAEPSHALNEVAFLLGFGDYSAFHRAVRRWFAVSPHTYRQQSR